MKQIVNSLFLLLPVCLSAQVRFSMATDVSLMRNFSPKQQFFAIGQTVQPLFHLNRKETVYAWINYFSAGKFKNTFTGVAKSPATTPQTQRFRVTGIWRSNEISFGWKHYIRGGFEDSDSWNLYSIAGFGLLSVHLENTFNPVIDTAIYQLAAPVQGINTFKRLTLDLGMGAEYPMGGSFFVYGDIRTAIPTSDYPSPYLHNNRNVPLPIILSAGLRILFDLRTY